jgi:hypothetical protein
MSDEADVASAVRAGEKFRSGRVIGRMFSGVAANGLFLWPLSFVFIGLPAAGMGYLTSTHQDGQFGGLLRSGIVGLFAVFVQGVVIRACLDQFAGKRRRVGRSLGAGVSKYAGMFGIRWLGNLGIAFGLVLLVVPGLIWATSWSVASAALVADDTGSQGPFARSAALTKGSRWPIFGLLLIFILVYFVLSVISGVVLALVWQWIAPWIPAVSNVTDAADTVATPIPLMLYEVFAAAGAASIYWELKLVRESGGIEAVSRVFA